MPEINEANLKSRRRWWMMRSAGPATFGKAHGVLGTYWYIGKITIARRYL